LLLQQAGFISATPCGLEEHQGSVWHGDWNSVCCSATQSHARLYQLL